MSTGIKVRDAMVPKVVTAKADQSILDISKIMRDQDVGSVIICQGTNPVGIVTREDIINKIVAKDVRPSEINARTIMSSNLISTSPDEDLANAARIMTKHGFERLPVVSMGKLIGIISDREIVKVAPAAIEILRERLLIEEPEPGPEEFNSGECELCGNFSEQLHNINDKWVCANCKDEVAEL